MLPMLIVSRAVRAAERARLPDAVIRLGIRRLLAARRRELMRGGRLAQEERRRAFVRRCLEEPIAAVPERANEQHYEVPAEFFRQVLGRRLKYSCCLWPPGVSRLDDAETAALEETCRRAGLENGQSVLDLGCGWGSLSLWIAERYSECRVTAVSNSATQREFIQHRAAERALTNLTVRTADINQFDPGETFDRILSVEMFEHARNHGELLRRIGAWLNPGGKLFVHVFCHRGVPYFFEPANDADWMSRYFFSGGIMPSDDLLPQYQSALSLAEQWRWNGRHYARTCEVWLANLDRNRAAILPILAETYGAANAELWLQRWRIFFMACAELFAYRGGDEWWVSHYLFAK